MGFVLRLLGIFVIDALDFQQGEKAFLFFRRPNLARDDVAGLQIEAANLRRRDINVLGAGEVVEALRAQEAESFREDFEHAFGEEDAAAFGVLLQDVEDHLVLAHGPEILDAHLTRYAIKIGHGHGLELGDVDRLAFDLHGLQPFLRLIGPFRFFCRRHLQVSLGAFGFFSRG